MEIRNTPAPPPVERRDSGRLLEDLCIALREMGVSDSWYRDEQQLAERVEKVQVIWRELFSRRVDPRARINQLSEETHWQMDRLLQDCLEYPRVHPYLRESDGIRRALRCRLCGERERPEDDQKFWVCNDCLESCIRGVDASQPIAGIVLYRTFNAGRRCNHADAETVLVGFEYYEDGWCMDGFCNACLVHERERRSRQVPS